VSNRLSVSYLVIWASGWDDWADEVEAEYDPDEFDTDVPRSIGGDVEAGDVVRFTEPPDARLDSTTFEVYHVNEGSDRVGDRREVHMRDKQGHTISNEVAAEDDHGVQNGDGVAGEFRYTGAADVQAVSRGFSDIEDPGNEFVTPDPSRFTDPGDSVSVDEYRDELDAETWKEQVDQLASHANRAYYEMYLKKEHEGVEEPIKDGYSSTTAAEVPSQLHEVFQSPSDSNAERAAEIAEIYPRLTAAYLEMFDPSPAVRGELEGVDGVSV